MKSVFLGIDVEQDCPPYLDTTRGVDAGMPALLALFATENIHVTFFVTGNIAQAYPELMRRIVAEGHELGCHGLTHRRFSEMSAQEAEFEIRTAATILRQYTDSLISFRAPCLDFPDCFLPLLTQYGFKIDSSTARFRKPYMKQSVIQQGLHRIPAAISASALRAAPRWFTYLRIAHLNHLALYLHPWEFVDMSKTPIPFGCRIKTGSLALNHLKRWIQLFKRKQYQFLLMREVLK